MHQQLVRSRLEILPTIDSDYLADERRRELDIPRQLAIRQGESALRHSSNGFYVTQTGYRVQWRDAIKAARSAKTSIPPGCTLPAFTLRQHATTRIQFCNETTLSAGRRMAERGLKPLALNFASGTHAGGGFLDGGKAQEETLCRSSALYLTLIDDPMYAVHAKRPQPDFTDWAILSPDVPVYRDDRGSELNQPWLLSVISSAAPFVPAIGQPRSADLLRQRIRRVLAIAQAWGYSSLVLGAWGCGACGHDPARVARDFREAIERDFPGAFDHITFAIADWSYERRTLSAFVKAFAYTGQL